jgi:hypothetical protein
MDPDSIKVRDLSPPNKTKMPERPTLSDLKRDWGHLMEDETHLKESFKLGQGFFKNRLDAVKFALIRMQHLLWNQYNRSEMLDQARKAGERAGQEILDQRNDLIYAAEAVLEHNEASLLGRRKLQPKEELYENLKSLITRIREDDEKHDELPDSAKPGGDRVGESPVPGMEQTVSAEAVPDSERGETEASDLPGSRERVQSTSPDSAG